MQRETADVAADQASPALSVTGLEKSYIGGVKVLDGVKFDVARGELLGVIGPNGSGKTTLFGTISGQLRPTAGQIFLNGVDVTSSGGAVAGKAGYRADLSDTPAFPRHECLRKPACRRSVCRRGSTVGKPKEHVLDILGRTSFLTKADMLAESLSLIERKRLELARALATRPKILLLDEDRGRPDGR